MNAIHRPVMRYHGGKWRLAPWIISHFPAHKVYVEPFGGAASVLMQKPRSYAEVYNDLDGEIVNLFRVLRDNDAAMELAWQLALTPFARDEYVLSYLEADGPVEQARRTLMRAAMSFSPTAIGKASGFRSNVTRAGSIPAHDWAHFPKQVPAFVARLAGVIVENLPALDVIRKYDGKDTLFYLDPPYMHQTRGAGQDKNYRHELDDEQHRELAALLNQCRGTAVISGYPCAEYDALYAGWRRVDRETNAQTRERRVECIWIKEAA